MDKTYAQRLHKYELALRGFFLVSLRLQIKPYNQFYQSNGYLGRPQDLIDNDALLKAYSDSYRYISDAETYPEWKRQDMQLKKSQKDIGVDDDFFVVSETLRTFFAQLGIVNYNKIRDDLNQTTIDSINKFVANARADGYSDAQIYEAMSSVYSDTMRTRAGVIASTEATTIFNIVKGKVADTFFDQKGVTGYKTWFTRQDERVRHTHTEVEGRTLPIDTKYVLNRPKGGVEFCDAPGDVSLSAENRIHCRCYLEHHSDPFLYSKKGD